MSETATKDDHQDGTVHFAGDSPTTFRNILYVAALAFVATKVLACDNFETVKRCWNDHLHLYYTPGIGIILLLVVIIEYGRIVLRQEKQGKNSSTLAEKPYLRRIFIRLDILVLCFCLFALQILHKSFQVIPNPPVQSELNQSCIAMAASIENLTESAISKVNTSTNSSISATESNSFSSQSQLLATNLFTSLRLIVSQHDLPDNDEPFRYSLTVGSVFAVLFFFTVIIRLMWAELVLRFWRPIKALKSLKHVMPFDFLGLVTCMFVAGYAHYNNLQGAIITIWLGVASIIFYYAISIYIHFTS